MNYKKSFSYFLLLSFAIIFSSCNGQSKDAAVEQTKKDDTAAAKDEIKTNSGTKPAPGRLSLGKGSLSFKMDGVSYQSDPAHTKCWTTASVPLAMMMAKGEDLMVSWQIVYTEGQTDYHVDKDKNGTVNFTIGDKTYWTRRVTGADYLDIKITHVKDKYSLKMLSGTFEGVLEDKDRNKVKITEGKFETEDIGGS